MPDAKYGEPWRAVNNRDEKCIVNSEWKYIALDVAPEERDRIVACVNAMSGIDDPTHAAEVLRLVGEFIEGGETTYYCRGYGDCCVFCDAVDTYDDPIEHDNDCIWAKLLAAARKMKEQP